MGDVRRLAGAPARWLVPVLVAIHATATAPAAAGEADVVAARVEMDSAGTYTLEVTVRHADTGWEHYADAFDVVGPDGAVLATRTLYHPHVDEQPFTRSLTGVAIPDGVGAVTVRAHDSVHGYGGATVTVRRPNR